MNKQKWIIVLGIVVGLTLFAYIQSFEHETTSTEEYEEEEMNREIIYYVNETDEEGLVRAFEKVAPGITYARELGLTNFFETNWNLEDSDDTLRIEEVWVRKEHPSFIFYSVGLEGELSSPHDLPKLTSRIQLDDIEMDYYSELFSDDYRELGNLYKDGRYYGVAVFYLPYYSPEVEVVQVDQIELMHTTVHKQGHVHQIEPIKLDIDYNHEEIPYKEINDQHAVTIGDVTIQLSSITAHPEKFDLLFKMEPHQDFILDSLWGHLTGAGERNSSTGQIEEENTYRLSYDAFEPPVGSITFSLDTIHLTSKESFQITIPTDKEKYENVMGDEVYKGEYGRVIIEGLSSNSNHYAINLRTETNEESPYHIDLTMMSLNDEDAEWTEEGHNEHIRPNLLTFSSNQKQLNPDIFVGGDGSDNTHEILLDRSKLEGIDEITLTFENLGMIINPRESISIPHEVFNY
ncbi:hypothetical protein RYX56_04965 [Alkalihalophilus lindianensis]|uniref:Uncharacterized protein n=1 Tax=Alkalihalophilus lindianensis TaxID=1630542 RepID=A0ABU3X753_9BACI|nr:hypothetical protein [Alkalihalophilus lindianensis]MDV2683726.1 hypothetical protein [Alkalihalophilus lindianensis]